jgi:tetratricopeptide (TPR) repeat protein
MLEIGAPMSFEDNVAARSILLNCVVILMVMVRAAAAQPHSWNNVEVLPKSEEVVLQVGDRQAALTFLPGIATEVNSERIRVQSGNFVGEMPKRDVLFASAAAPYFDDLVRRNPDDLWALQCRAIAHYCAGHLDAAQGDIEELIRRKPSDAVAYAHRARIWPAHDDDTLRFKDYDKAIRLNPDFAPAYWERGLLWESYGDSSKAAADYGNVIRLDPTNVQALRLRVYCWCDLKQFDKAVLDCDALIKIDPKDAKYWCFVAMPIAGSTPSTSPFRTTPRPSDFFRRIRWHSCTGPVSMQPNRNTKSRLPTFRRQSGLARGMPRPASGLRGYWQPVPSKACATATRRSYWPIRLPN